MMTSCLFCCLLIVCVCCEQLLAASDKSLSSELHRAAASKDGSADSLLSVINRGADVHALTKDGESVLHLSCIYGHAAKVKLLLSNGADPNMRAQKLETSLYMTALSWCAYGGHNEAVSTLLQDSRTNVNLVVLREDKTRMTALDIAESMGEMGEHIGGLLRGAGGLRFEELLQQAQGSEDAVTGMPQVIDYSLVRNGLEAEAEAEVAE